MDSKYTPTTVEIENCIPVNCLGYFEVQFIPCTYRALSTSVKMVIIITLLFTINLSIKDSKVQKAKPILGLPSTEETN